MGRAARAGKLAVGLAVLVAIVLLGKPGTAAPGVVGLRLGLPGVAALQARPLPASLAAIPLRPEAGDYFDRIEPTLLGYLLWSRFPIRVYVDPGAKEDRVSAFTRQQSETWQKAVGAALEEWGAYLPLERSLQPDGADILIWQQAPPPALRRDPETGRLQPRARAGTTQYEFYLHERPGQAPTIAHRMKVYLGTKSSLRHLQATARHELGHALGLWGHSDRATDALYPQQVGEPPPISDRDINTLIRLYQQPSRLGWTLEEPEN